MISVTEDGHLLVSNKKDKRIKALEIPAEFNSTRQHPIYVVTIKRKYITPRLKRWVSVNKLKREK